MGQPSRNGLVLLAALVLGTMALSFGEALLMPLALAVLLSFLLAPLVTRVERIGVGRIPAVIVVCLLIGSLLAGVGWIVARSRLPFVATGSVIASETRGSRLMCSSFLLNSVEECR